MKHNLTHHLNFTQIPLLLFLLILCITLVSPSCRKKQETLHPFGWSKIDPEFDSLILAAEYAYFDMSSDSVKGEIVEKMRIASEKDPSQTQKKNRYRYWNARRFLNEGKFDEAFAEFNDIIAHTDSARYPYDVARLRWNMELEEPWNADDYFRLLREIQLFKDLNDIPYQGDYNIVMGNLLTNVGNPNAAAVYYDAADSLLRLSGFEGKASRIVINRARALEKSGDEPAAAQVLRNALEDSTFRQEKMAENIAQWNLYLYTDSLHWLQKAFAGLPGDFFEEEFRPIYASHLVKVYGRLGEKDSVLKYMAIVEADTANFNDRPDYWRDYYIGTGEGLRALGRYNEAAESFSSALDLISLMDEDDTAETVTELDQRLTIEKATHAAEIKRRDRTVALLVTLLAITLVSATVIIIYRRKLTRQREKILKESLEHEQSRRKVLALELAMEENRRLSDDLRKTVETLQKQGLVDTAASGALEATIRTHNINMPARDAFVETFSELNPRFFNVLDTKYPGLSKSERRLAAYIALGLDNKHIARMLGIRPESVKQARWRLRQKLNLQEGESMDDVLRNLAPKIEAPDEPESREH